MIITDIAIAKLRKNYESARVSNDYGNGRYVRKLLEEAEMNLAERVSQLCESDLTTKIITTLEETDIPESETMKCHEEKKIGFCV